MRLERGAVRDTGSRKLPVMYLLFVDESGQPDERAFASGGIAVRADEWAVLRDLWFAALDAARWPRDLEAKWHGVRTGTVPPALADALFAALAQAPVVCFVVVLKPLAAKQLRPDLFATAEDVYANGLMWLAERYQLFLSRNHAYGMSSSAHSSSSFRAAGWANFQSWRHVERRRRARVPFARVPRFRGTAIRLGHQRSRRTGLRVRLP